MISVVMQCMLITKKAHVQAFVQTLRLHIVFLQMLPVPSKLLHWPHTL